MHRVLIKLTRHYHSRVCNYHLRARFPQLHRGWWCCLGLTQTGDDLKTRPNLTGTRWSPIWNVVVLKLFQYKRAPRVLIQATDLIQCAGMCRFMMKFVSIGPSWESMVFGPWAFHVAGLKQRCFQFNAPDLPDFKSRLLGRNCSKWVVLDGNFNEVESDQDNPHSQSSFPISNQSADLNGSEWHVPPNSNG